jgi:hypothetical protein
MIYEIKDRWNNEILFSTEVDSRLSFSEQTRLAVEAAIKSGANLSEADLSGAYLQNADLSGANLSEADLSGANLSYAYLSDANLSEADLSGAYLHNADLSGANLSEADLSGADLIGADLQNADLSGADLRGADLQGANLRGTTLESTVGNKKQLHSIFIEKYDVCFGLGIMQIGCQRHLISEWKAFDDCTIEKMDNGALDWWKKWKGFIFTAIELVEGK